MFLKVSLTLKSGDKITHHNHTPVGLDKFAVVSISNDIDIFVVPENVELIRLLVKRLNGALEYVDDA